MTEHQNWIDQLSDAVADPLERRQARGLWIMLLGAFGAATAAFLAVPLILGSAPATIVLESGAALVMLAAGIGIGLLYQGKFQAAVISLAAGVLLAGSAIMIIFSFPAASSVLSTLLIAVVFSGLLHSRLSAIVMSIAAILSGILTLAIEPFIAPFSATVKPNADLSILTITLFTLTTIVIWIALDVFSQSLRAALRQSQQDRTQLEQALYQAHEQAETQRQLNAELQQTRTTLQNLVTSLETPSVVLAEGVLLAPIVGQIDRHRAADLSTRLINEAAIRRAHMVILDVTGVPTIDTAVAKELMDIALGLRLLGCQITISGISPAVARTLADNAIDLAGLSTVRNPQDALTAHMRRIAEL